MFAALEGELKSSFQSLLDAQAKLNALSGIDGFIYGYRLGVLMTMEVFNGRAQLLAGSEV